MTIELIGFIALGFGLFSIFCEPAFIVYVFLCSTLLGSAAAIILDSLGGTNISPAHLLLGFLTFKLIGSGKLCQEFGAGTDVRPCGILAAADTDICPHLGVCHAAAIQGQTSTFRFAP
jgi:hypothetical protein